MSFSVLQTSLSLLIPRLSTLRHLNHYIILTPECNINLKIIEEKANIQDTKHFIDPKHICNNTLVSYLMIGDNSNLCILNYLRTVKPNIHLSHTNAII